MYSKQSDGFALIAPSERDPEKQMPATLEVVDYKPARSRGKPSMGGGAYNPYERPIPTGDTARMKRPKIDLRKLSEWIKTTQQVKSLREDEGPTGEPIKR